MPTLPQAIDYSKRPSLRSNRLDLPGTGDLATGAAMERAASTFAQILGEHQAKEDRLNYSLAKNELLLASIAEREKLKDDREHETWDERFTAGYNEASDGIFTKYNFSAGDRQLLGAESDLIRERARVQVGDAARTMDLDIKQATVRENLLIAEKEILNLDLPTANDLMLTQLENIQAAVAEGVFDANVGLTLSQNFVTDTAYARLVAMDAKPRIVELKRSLAHRKSIGGAITVDAIRAGKGTGSIADFLNKDTLVKMLRLAEKENVTEDALLVAFEVNDAAWIEHPEYENSKEREEIINAQTKNNPAARKEALILHRQRTNDEARGEAAQRKEMGFGWSERITDGTATFSDIPAAEREIMGPEWVTLLQTFAENQPEREGYGEFDDDVTYYKWRDLSDQGKAAEPLMSAEWKGVLTRQTHQRFVDEQDVIRRRIESSTPTPSYKGDTDDEYLTNVLLGGQFFKERPTPGQPGYDRWARIDKAVDDALKDESMQRIRDGKSGDLNADDRRDILNETLKQQVFLRRDRFGPNILWLEKYERKPAFLVELTPEQAQEAFVPIEIVEKDIWDIVGTKVQYADEFLRGLAPDDVDPSDKDIEEAYFYLVYHGQQAAKNRLAGLKGY